MAKKLADDAFEFYFALGSERSYEAVAAKYGVTKKTVSRRATEEGWVERLEEVKSQAKAKSNDRLSETIAEMHTRHLKMLKAVQGRALKAVQEHPLNTGIQGMRMIEMAIKMERLIRAEPNERDQSVRAEELAVKIRSFVVEMDGSIPKALPGAAKEEGAG